MARNSYYDQDRASSPGFPRQSDPVTPAPSRKPAQHAASGHHAEILDFERISATRGVNEAAQNASFSSFVSSRARQTGADRNRTHHQAEHPAAANEEESQQQNHDAGGVSVLDSISAFFQRFASMGDASQKNADSAAAAAKGEEGRKARGRVRASERVKNGEGSADKASKHRLHVSFDWIASSRPAQISAIVCACLILGCAFVYPSAKDAYTAVRNADQAQAEYQAVVDRNNEIQSRIDTLKTDEGIEDLARNSYGYVMSGENSVRVAGLGSQSIAADAENQTPAIASGSVAPPQTWYSPVLDVVFGYTPDNATTASGGSSNTSNNQ